MASFLSNVGRVLRGTSYASPESEVFKLAMTMQTEFAPRNMRYNRMWRMYNGEHWPDLYGGEDQTELLTINKCRTYADFMLAFTYAQGWSVVIPDNPSTPDSETVTREFVQHKLDETLKKNNVELLTADIGLSAGVTGDAFCRVSWAEDDMDGSYAKVEILPGTHCYPVFAGPAGPDGRALKSILLLFPRYADTGEAVRVLPSGPDLRRGIVIHGERWTKETFEEFHPDGRVTTKPNVYGEIPVVHFANLTKGEYYGVSDIEDVAKVQQAFNAKVTDLSDILAYQASPITVLEGAKVANLDRGKDKLWGLPAGSKMYNLEMKSDQTASLNFITFLSNAMNEMAGIPTELLTGDMKELSASTLALKYFPLIYRRKLKLAQFSIGMRHVNRLILKITSIFDTAFGAKMDKLSGPIYANEIVFPPPFPRDESLELDRSEKRLTLGLSTRERELVAQGKSVEEAKKIVEEARAEKRADMEMQAETDGLYPAEARNPLTDKPNKGNPSPKRGNPDVTGQRRSDSNKAQ